MADPRDDELLQRFLDGGLDSASGDELGRRLEADPQLARRLAGLVVVDGALRQRRLATDAAKVLRALPAGQGESTQRIMRRVQAVERGRVRRLRRALVGWAIAAGLLVAVGAAAWRLVPGLQALRAGDEGLVLVEARGAVALVLPDGERIAAIGAALLPGARLRLAPGARALISGADGVSCTLDEAARLAVVAVGGGGLRLRLDEGRLAATVAPRPSSSPCVIETPDAEATVVGTTFVLMVQPGLATALTVEQGRVLFGRRGGERRLVVAGMRVTADEQTVATKQPPSDQPGDPAALQQPARGEERIVPVLDDAHCDTTRPLDAFGVGRVLLVEQEGGRRDVMRRYALLRFDLRHAGEVRRARLRLHVEAASGGVAVHAAYGSPAWKEAEVRDLDAPHAGRRLAQAAAPARPGIVDIPLDLLPPIGGMLDLVLMPEQGARWRVASRETNKGPALVVE